MSRRAGLRGQVEDAVAEHDPRRYAPVADLITSVPGESARRLRARWYELLNLPEPDGVELRIGDQHARIVAV